MSADKGEHEDEEIKSFTLDPLTGTLWLANKRSLLGFNRSGQQLSALDLRTFDLKHHDILALDAPSLSLWLAGKKTLAHFSSTGAFIAKIPVEEELEAIGVTPFKLVPSLTLLQPQPGALSNNAKLPIRLSLSAICNGVPCNVGNAYLDGFQLNVSLNGAPIGPLFTNSHGEAGYIPSERYPEGPNILTAQATDAFGHISTSMTSQFTIDTIPPEIRLETPAASLTRISSQIFTGTISEPARLTINEQIVLLDVERRFQYPVTLKEGVNTFLLTAIDLAGNVTQRTVVITLDTIPPQFISLTPADGSVVTTPEVIVSGSLDDASASITLENLAAFNGEVLSSNPLNFSFRVRLPPGSNTLVFTAQDPAGNTRQANLRLTYNPLNVKVTNPAPGAVVANENLLVMGTYEGPLNTGITVNGVVATLFGKEFFATVPLSPGENTLTITATTIDGATATQTLTVNSAGTSGITVERVPVSVAESTLVTTIAGNGTFNYSGDGGPATQASLGAPAGVAWGIDGSLYIADTGNHRIRHIAPNGTITTIAGNGISGFAGDGGPATQAKLNSPSDIKLGPGQSLYFADLVNSRIRRIDAQGVITTVAGNGVFGYSGDGGPATQARLNFPRGIAVAPDGTVYIADTFNHRIRQVTPNGVITTIAGMGVGGYSGDGGPATQAKLTTPSAVALGQDGNLYIADTNNYRIRRVAPDGIISTIAGIGIRGVSGDTGPATKAHLTEVFGIALGRDGSIYLSDSELSRIRVVRPDNVITTFAGTTYGYAGDNGPPNKAQFATPIGLAINQLEQIAIADKENGRIRKVATVNVTGTGAPLLAAFQVSNHTSKTLQKIEVDFDGNGTIDFTTTNVTAVIKHVYELPGAYLAKFIATDSGGQTHTQPLLVVLQDLQTMDQLFNGLWNGMNEALKNGDLSGAGKFLNEGAKLRYQPIFQALKQHIPEITASFSPLQRVSVSEDIGEYAINRQSNGQNRLYLIYFLRDADGVWRVDGM